MYYNRANVKLQLDDPNSSMLDYNIAIQLDPNYAAAYMGRGNAKLKLGSRTGASIDWAKGEKILGQLENSTLIGPVAG